MIPRPRESEFHHAEQVHVRRLHYGSPACHAEEGVRLRLQEGGYSRRAGDPGCSEEICGLRRFLLAESRENRAGEDFAGEDVAGKGFGSVRL